MLQWSDYDCKLASADECAMYGTDYDMGDESDIYYNMEIHQVFTDDSEANKHRRSFLFDQSPYKHFLPQQRCPDNMNSFLWKIMR